MEAKAKLQEKYKNELREISSSYSNHKKESLAAIDALQAEKVAL